ncbi:hypothetical protein [Carbonactinospora thermoautotrophica]|nr:hypothetical protein [Carbonactinospora thermoautotrophica]
MTVTTSHREYLARLREGGCRFDPLASILFAAEASSVGSAA